jgi:molybdopterin-guanine dinucleotide biosynthesis protein A
MHDWTAIVLAGQRPGETEFPESRGVSAKALIPVAGEPMLERVVRTLLGCPSIGRVVVLSQAAEALLGQAPAWLRDEPRVAAADSGDGISASIAAIAGTATAPWPVLVTTADHALLTCDMVETFLAGAAGGDAAFAVVDRPTIERAYPETRRTWLKFSDGHYSGANLFALAGADSGRALDFWSRIERDRKKALKMLTFFGPTIFVRVLTRTISLDDVAARVGNALRLRLRPVRLPFAEAAIDVDKPSDLELVERIVARGAPAPASC